MLHQASAVHVLPGLELGACVCDGGIVSPGHHVQASRPGTQRAGQQRQDFRLQEVQGVHALSDIAVQLNEVEISRRRSHAPVVHHRARLVQEVAHHVTRARQISSFRRAAGALLVCVWIHQPTTAFVPAHKVGSISTKMGIGYRYVAVAGAIGVYVEDHALIWNRWGAAVCLDC